MTLYEYWKRHTPGAFADGVHLLAKHCPKAVTRHQLSSLLASAAQGGYVSQYECGKVEDALRANSAPADTTPPPPPPPPVPDELIQEAEPPGDPRTPGAASQVLTSTRAKALHKEHAHYHALLVAATTDEARAEYATRIMTEIIPALDAEYDRLRAGGSPEAEPAAAPPVADDSSAAQLRRLQTIRVRLSKLKGLIATAPSVARRQQLETEQAEKQAERDRLETLLRT